MQRWFSADSEQRGSFSILLNINYTTTTLTTHFSTPLLTRHDNNYHLVSSVDLKTKENICPEQDSIGVFNGSTLANFYPAAAMLSLLISQRQSRLTCPPKIWPDGHWKIPLPKPPSFPSHCPMTPGAFSHLVETSESFALRRQQQKLIFQL